jgi:hypothetical protein
VTTKGFIVQIDGDDYEGIYDCGDHYRVTLLPGHLAAIALANGYVKAADYEALKAKLAEVTDQLTDATDTLDQIEAESACFDGLARSAGYVKLEPGQVVVNASDVGDALDALCDTCAGNCEMCPTREILFAIKEARDARV